MSGKPIKTLVIIDEKFEKIEGHYYEYDKSVADIFKQHGIETVIYGHQKMIEAFQKELGARPWFTINAESKVRKIPILGPILYRTGFWKKYEREIRAIIHEVSQNGEGFYLFFPNVYWYNILPIARALKKVQAPSALLYRVSIYDTVRLPKKILPVLLRIVRSSVSKLKPNKNVHYFTDSEVIAKEWTDTFGCEMRVLPIPHLELNRKDTAPAPGEKIRMYLPGGMRLEKGTQMLTEAFELLASTRPKTLEQITLVTQFLGNDPVLDAYKERLTALPMENVFLKHLTTEEYNRQLRIADVILIPYQVSEGYRARTSGILAEAIASAKPFITTDGTWMSLQANNYDTGLIVSDGKPDDLANAIVDISSHYNIYYDKATKACDRWMVSQSKEVFFRQMISYI